MHLCSTRQPSFLCSCPLIHMSSSEKESLCRVGCISLATCIYAASAWPTCMHCMDSWPGHACLWKWSTCTKHIACVSMDRRPACLYGLKTGRLVAWRMVAMWLNMRTCTLLEQLYLTAQRLGNAVVSSPSTQLKSIFFVQVSS